MMLMLMARSSSIRSEPLSDQVDTPGESSGMIPMLMLREYLAGRFVEQVISSSRFCRCRLSRKTSMGLCDHLVSTAMGIATVYIHALLPSGSQRSETLQF